MNPFSAIIFGLGSAIGWGSADYFAIHGATKLSGLKTAFFSQMWGVLLATGLILLTGTSLKAPNWAIASAFGLAILFGLALVSFYSSLAKGPISVVSPLGNSYALITLSIAILLVGERPAGFQLIGSLLVVTGVLIASLVPGANGRSKDRGGIMFAAIAAILWGIAFSLNGPVIQSLGWIRYTFYQNLTLSIFLALVSVLTNRSQKLFGGVSNKAIVAVAATQFIGTISFNFGRSISLASVITPVSSLLVLVTIGLAIIFLGEKPTKTQLGGAFIVVAGLALLSV